MNMHVSKMPAPEASRPRRGHADMRVAGPNARTAFGGGFDRHTIEAVAQGSGQGVAVALALVQHVGKLGLRVALGTKMPAIRWVGLRHVDNFVIDALGICGCDAGNAAERLGEWRSGARAEI